MNFCAQCGAPVQLRVPEGDHLPRYTCDACGTIHYQNPRLVVGCVPEHDGRILLCRRAIEPRRGFWTVPAGFHGERRDPAAGGRARIPGGGARARSKIGSLLAVVHVLHAQQVHVFFRADPAAGRVRRRRGKPGSRAGRAPADIPWADIAFPSTDFTLRRYLEDRAAGARNTTSPPSTGG